MDNTFDVYKVIVSLSKFKYFICINCSNCCISYFLPKFLVSKLFKFYIVPG